MSHDFTPEQMDEIKARADKHWRENVEALRRATNKAFDAALTDASRLPLCDACIERLDDSRVSDREPGGSS